MRESGLWTANPAHAKSFETPDQARAAIKALGLTEIELYFSNRDESVPQMDFRVSLSSFDNTPVRTGGFKVNLG
jgi:hypothetical protein